MRIRILKSFAFLAWALFLFTPFLARADEGFGTYLPVQAQGANAARFSVGGVTLQLDEKSVRIPVEGKWSLKLNAGRATAVDGTFPASVRDDRAQSYDGGQKALMFGVGLSYKF